MYAWSKDYGEWTLEMVVRAHRESEMIKKVCDGEERKEMASSHWKMAWISTVKIDAELR